MAIDAAQPVADVRPAQQEAPRKQDRGSDGKKGKQGEKLAKAEDAQAVYERLLTEDLPKETAADGKEGKGSKESVKVQALETTLGYLTNFVVDRMTAFEGRLDTSQRLVQDILSRLPGVRQDAQLKNFTAETLSLMRRAQIGRDTAQNELDRGRIVIASTYRHRTAGEQRFIDEQLEGTAKDVAAMNKADADKKEAERAAKAAEDQKEKDRLAKEQKTKETEAAREAEAKRPKRDPKGIWKEIVKAREFLFAAQGIERGVSNPRSEDMNKARLLVHKAQEAVDERLTLYAIEAGKPVDWDAMNAELKPEKIAAAGKTLHENGMQVPRIREFGPQDILRQIVRFREVAFAADGLSKEGKPDAMRIGSVVAKEMKSQLEAHIKRYEAETGEALSYAQLNQLLDKKRIAAARQDIERIVTDARSFGKLLKERRALFKQIEEAGGKDYVPADVLKQFDVVKKKFFEAYMDLTQSDQAVIEEKWQEGWDVSEVMGTAVRNAAERVREESVTHPFVFPGPLPVLDGSAKNATRPAASSPARSTDLSHIT
ncbi:hypothetical protein HY734_01335 [Candidatus Uhrbacteria bacterium]|nr:hypothetical protein [Candidatus Uhrbacteria bacterium]